MAKQVELGFTKGDTEVSKKETNKTRRGHYAGGELEFLEKALTELLTTLRNPETKKEFTRREVFMLAIRLLGQHLEAEGIIGEYSETWIWNNLTDDLRDKVANLFPEDYARITA